MWRYIKVSEDSLSDFIGKLQRFFRDCDIKLLTRLKLSGSKAGSDSDTSPPAFACIKKKKITDNYFTKNILISNAMYKNERDQLKEFKESYFDRLGQWIYGVIRSSI